MQSLNHNQHNSFSNNSTNLATPIPSSHSNKRPCSSYTSIICSQTIENVAKPIFQIIYSFLSFHEQSLAASTHKKFNLAFIDAREKFNWQEHPTYNLLTDYTDWYNKKNETKMQLHEVLSYKLPHIRNLALYDISVLALALHLNGPLPNLNSIKICLSETRDKLNFMEILVNNQINSIENPFKNQPHLFELISQKCPKLEHLSLLEPKYEEDAYSNNVLFDKDMSRIFEKCSELKSFSCWFDSLEGLESLAKVNQDYIPLTELDIADLGVSDEFEDGYLYEDEDEENLSKVLKKAPNLQKINLGIFGTNVLLQYGNNNLQSISIYNFQSIPLDILTKKFNNLTTLKLTSFFDTFIKKIDESDRLEFVSNDNWYKYCPNLTDLDLLLDPDLSDFKFPIGLSEEQEKCFPYNEEYIGKMLSYLPQLIRLRLLSAIGDQIKGFNILNQDFILSKIVDYNKNLEELGLATGPTQVKNYTDNGLVDLYSGCPKFKDIYIICSN